MGQMRGTSLKARCARSSIILSAATFGERGLRFIRNMILARLLAPDEFGLMAIVLSTSVIFEAFTDVGVKQSVIQNKRGAEPQYLNIVWWFQAIRGLGLFMLALVAAPWISSFYEQPDLLPLLRVAFLGILFGGLMSPRAYVLEKEFRFGKVALLGQGSGFLGTAITIILVFMMRNIWALVIGFVGEAVVFCLLSYALVPFQPSFRIDKECLGELMKFARGMLGLPILTIIAMRTDIMVLGKVVAMGQLGMYHMALLVVQYPMTFFGKIISPLLLPAFSENQKDNRKLGDMVLVVTQAVAVFGMPFVMFMIICARPMLTVIYGSEYSAVAVPFSILCVYVLVYVQAVPVSTVFLALGQPHVHRKFVALRVMILVALIYPSIVWFGLSGAAMSMLLGYLIVLWIQVIYMRKTIAIRIGDYVTRWLQGLLMSVVVLVAFALLRFFGKGSLWMVLVTMGLSCLGAWGIGLVFLWYYHSTNSIETKTRSCLGSMRMR